MHKRFHSNIYVLVMCDFVCLYGVFGRLSMSEGVFGRCVRTYHEQQYSKRDAQARYIYVTVCVLSPQMNSIGLGSYSILHMFHIQ